MVQFFFVFLGLYPSPPRLVILVERFTQGSLLIAVRCGVLQCCSVLQCVVVCCSVFCSALQCVAVRCSVLQCVVVCCSVLRCFAVRCSVLHCVAVCCSVLQCVVVCCDVLQCLAVCCSIIFVEHSTKGSLLYLTFPHHTWLFQHYIGLF